LKYEIVAQKLLLCVCLVTGYFLVLFSPINYYGIFSTILLLLTFGGGIFANHLLNNSWRKDNGDYPSVSIIVPAKNEEKLIYETIKKCAIVNYPKEKLEIIIVDDGSNDNTWREIKRATRDFSRTVEIKAFSFGLNKGKREALAHGIRQSHGEIIVTADSDTFLGKESLHYLIRPFQDERVAGVTGHTYVRNRDKNLLTKMQTGLYFYAYRVVRSFEAMFGTVLCLPGTLSAFRKTCILQVLDEWQSARPFIGEDRHLTYLMLRQGYKTVYVKDAECETIVPETLRVYLSQQIRWAKGYLIETFRGCQYMFKRHPIIAFSYYTQYLLTLYLPLAIIRIFILLLTISPYWWTYFTFVGIAFFAKALYSCHTSKDRSCWAMSMFLMMNLLMNAWRIPIALLTISEKTRWTRQS